MRISVRRLIRRRLSNFLPSSYRANVVYPTSYPSPNSAVEPSDDISHSYVDDADLNIAQPVNSFGDQENTNSELATIIRESTVHRLREEMVAVGGGHAPMEEDSNGGGPEGEKGIDMHDSLVVETGVRYQCSCTIRSFNACVEFRNTDLPLVLEEGEDDDGGGGGDGGDDDDGGGGGGGGDGDGGGDGGGGDGGDDDNGGVFVATRECTTSEEEESDGED